MGRTGTLHAWEQEGIAPDIQAIAKGLGGGYQPIGAMLASGNDHRHHPRTARARSSTATPIWRIPSPAPPRWRCRRSSARSDLLDQRQGARRAARAAADRALRQSPPCRRYQGPRPVPGDRARRRPRHAHAVRSRAQAQSADQGGSLRRRAWLLSDGRNRGRPPRRPCAAGAALHRHARRYRYDRRQARPGRRRRVEKCWSLRRE